MPEADDTIHFIADKGDARLRLDQVLVRRVTQISRMSRSVAQQWIESGAVSVDHHVASRPAARVREGAAVHIVVPPSAVRRVRPAPERGDVDVLFEDGDLLVVNKPAGVVVHPSYKQLSGTLLNAVLWRLGDRADATPGIVTRLDKDTSGIVIIALSAAVHSTMQRDAAAGLIDKQYIAVVHGVPDPPEGTIAHPLARDPNDRRRVVTLEGGAPSETRYQTLAVSDDGAESIVRCKLVTGRTHQIRVHLAAQGWAIVGDRVYGAPDERIARQALHAWRVAFPHPVTRERREIVAPVPDDMKRLVPARVHID